MKIKYPLSIDAIWKKAPLCNCGDQDCHPNNHRLCSICGKKILYGAHDSVAKQRTSPCAWSKDYKKQLDKKEMNNIDNLRAVHLTCSTRKNKI